MSVFQTLAALFALFMIYWVRTSYKRGHLTMVESYFWYSIWLAFTCLSIFPNFLLGIAHGLHFARVFDLLVVMAFMILTTLLFSLYLKNKKMEQKMEQLVRKFAIEKK